MNLNDTTMARRSKTADMASGVFKEHVLTPRAEKTWICRKIGSPFYAFSVHVEPGMVVLWGDIGDFVFRHNGSPAEDTLSWFVASAMSDDDYLLRKIVAMAGPRERFCYGDAIAHLDEVVREASNDRSSDGELTQDAKLRIAEVAESCGGEICSVKGCDRESTHKLGEEIPHDEPCSVCGGPGGNDECVIAHGFNNRHNLTAYVCCGHFKMIVGKAAPCGETHHDTAMAAHEMIMGAVSILQTVADKSTAKNYIALEIVGLTLPFDRLNVELIRPGGKIPAHIVTQARLVAVDTIALLGRLSNRIDDPHLDAEVRDTVARLEAL